MALQTIKDFFKLGNDINRAPMGEEATEGVVGDLASELSVDTPDKELLEQEKDWMRRYLQYERGIRQKQTRNENYWRGNHDEFIFKNTERDLPLTDNKIFEAQETFLPQATRKNPEPIVSTDDTEEGNLLADNIRNMLLYLADRLLLKLKIKSAVRNWSMYYLGVMKVGWSFVDDEMTLTPLRPQKLILDPDATVHENGEYTGNYLGEIKEDTASSLVRKFPDKQDHIQNVVKGKFGTKVRYREWWADGGEIVFWTLKGEVLDKKKNPHWNFDTTEESVDEMGEPIEKDVEGRNHFSRPQFPYVFLSIFNLGLHPHDDTNLIEQNISQQDLINRRQRQIDENVGDMNGGWAISGERSGITKEQSWDAIKAFRDGRGVWVPRGNVNEAVQRVTGGGLPADVFNQLADARNELRSIFGVQGSTPQGIASEETVRGKIQVRQLDDTRVGGGIAEYIEQFADRIYNWMVQLIIVYYDEERVGSIIGTSSAMEYVRLSSEDIDRKILVSVKEGSMIPKDPLTQRNEALDLWSAQAIDPITLHSRLDMPNPRESAKQAFLWKTQPNMLFPELAPPAEEAPAEVIQ